MGVDSIIIQLNRLYIIDKDKYKEECDYWKSKDYKIYRDNKGRHKVIEPQKRVDQKAQINESFKEIFGDAFGDIGGVIR